MDRLEVWKVKSFTFLTDDAKPFCVNTPRSIPFAYCDKLKAELDLLQSQHIIAPQDQLLKSLIGVLLLLSLLALSMSLSMPGQYTERRARCLVLTDP